MLKFEKNKAVVSTDNMHYAFICKYSAFFLLFLLAFWVCQDSKEDLQVKSSLTFNLVTCCDLAHQK